MDFMLRAARRTLAKYRVTIKDLHISTLDGIVYHNDAPSCLCTMNHPGFSRSCSTTRSPPTSAW
eukprot:4147783-Amphidinium_carterae.2